MGYFISFLDGDRTVASGYVFEFFGKGVFDELWIKEELTRLGGPEQKVDLLRLPVGHPFNNLFSGVDYISLSY